jgi:hypothetical protein
MIYQNEEYYQYLLNKKFILMVFINYYHLIKIVIDRFSLERKKKSRIFILISIDDILIFVRLYNSRDESLLYIGHFLFPQQQTFRKKSFCLFLLYIFVFVQ